MEIATPAFEEESIEKDLSKLGYSDTLESDLRYALRVHNENPSIDQPPPKDILILAPIRGEELLVSRQLYDEATIMAVSRINWISSTFIEDKLHTRIGDFKFHMEDERSFMMKLSNNGYSSDLIILIRNSMHNIDLEDEATLTTLIKLLSENGTLVLNNVSQKTLLHLISKGLYPNSQRNSNIAIFSRSTPSS